ncbi:hypothetical protein M404DRAFT_32241 [Pisolithus tinctorius Marx 270]|uniref:Uncharacterized protein n=1 Tax=Pisolithus tinctorius Marx 270 TaxID=870435 RepID=A0A0C3N8W2_PISTI|nr:hypothetical protein M404DRAFT_32241 [Pisolithus tinctorius Marx 270]
MNPDLSTEELAHNQAALEEKRALIFNPALTESGPIENGFCILYPPTPRTESPTTQHTAPNAATHPTIEVLCSLNHQIDNDGTQVSSSSAFFKHGDPCNIALCTTGDNTSNDTSILCAILEFI